MDRVMRRRREREIEYLILKLLLTAKNYSFENICSFLDLHPKTASKCLDNFEARSLVIKKPMGNSFFYMLNESDKDFRDRIIRFHVIDIGKERVDELNKSYNLEILISS